MPKRVLIDQNGIKVSLPGYDVDAATLAQLAFDSRFPNVGVYMRGSVSFTGAAGLDGTGATVFFGESLARPPFCVCYSDQDYRMPWYFNTSTSYRNGLIATVGTSFVDFRYYTGFGTINVYYTLFRNLG